ncbi:MAG: AMP-binding protein, partial [Nitrolancea sp.]
MTTENHGADISNAPPTARPWLKWYEPGVPYSVTVPDRPLHRLLSDTAARCPNRNAILFMGRSMSFQELDDSVTRFANALIDLGVEPGDRVALVMPNCPQMVISYYGTLRAGAVVVPTNPLYVESELEHQLNDAGVKVVVILSMFYEKLQAVRSRIPSLEHVIVTNIGEYLPSLSKVLFRVAKERQEGHLVHLPDDGRTHWFQRLLEQSSTNDPDITVSADSVAILQYTSGTTGQPKGAMLSHLALAIGAAQAHVWCVNVTRPDGADVVLGAIPLFHIYAQTTVMNYPIAGGGTMILLPRFGLKDVLTAIDHEKPDLFPGVPAMYVVINGASSANRYNL